VISVRFSITIQFSERATIAAMNKKRLLFTVALFSIINGTAYLFFTRFSLSILDVRASDFGFMITRYYGACALGYGFLLWIMNGIDSNQADQAGLLSILIVLIPSSIVGLLGTLNGTFNYVGWVFVLTDFSLSISALLCLRFHPG
jgi:hypothetical protein